MSITSYSPHPSSLRAPVQHLCDTLKYNTLITLTQVLYPAGYLSRSPGILPWEEAHLARQRALPLLPPVCYLGHRARLLTDYAPHRYKIRGIRNLIFYAPPDHPQFYTEFLSYPFLDEGVEIKVRGRWPQRPWLYYS